MVYDELSTIKQAIAHEYEGYEYYLSQSKKWNSDEICNLFKEYAEEELLHVKWLEELLKYKTEGLTLRMLKLVDEISPPDIFDWKQVKNFKFEDLKEVFKHIMDLEMAAVEFYKEISEKAKDEATKEIFKRISDWELAHYQTFKNKYDEI